MPAPDRGPLAGTRWIHVEGDDDARGALFRAAGGDIPLSRRPREVLEFDADGGVRLSRTGPDDRAREVARGACDGDRITLDAPDARGATEYRVVERSDDRLVIRRG
jgi:hypothetical protein